MSASKYYLRFPVTQITNVSVEDVVNLFHAWIKDEDSNKVLLDVADYTHVPNGPGVMLIGFYENLAFEINAKEPAFLVTYKRSLEGDTEEKIAHIAAKASHFAAKFEKAFEGKITLSNNFFQIGLNDRLPEIKNSVELLLASIEKLNSGKSFGWKAEVNPSRDPKKLPEVNVTTETSRNLEEWASFLASSSTLGVSIRQ